MTKKIRFNVLSAVTTVASTLEDSKFNIKSNKAFDLAVKRLDRYFGVSSPATCILCSMISYYFDSQGETCDFNDLARFFDCSVMMLISCKDDVEELLKKGYISNIRGVDSRKIALKNEFMLSESLLNFILRNEKISIEVPENKKRTAIDLIRKIGRMVTSRDMERFQILTESMDLEENYEDNPFVKAVMKLVPGNIMLRIFFYNCCDDFLSDCESMLNRSVRLIYGDDMFDAMKSFMREDNALFTKNLIELSNKENALDATVELTSFAKELLLGDDARLFNRMEKGTNIINPDSIVTKKMFYDKVNESDMQRLAESLKDETLKDIQKRLKEKGLPKGIAVLMYGAPGTGKTESVYQLAKSTGRRVFAVDISSSKSCWFGESEKIIKKIFTGYRQFCKACLSEKDGKTPILFFNEADAILSRRQENIMTPSAQTENTMQNIILEEMEKLEGIMIATTNLVGNLDNAFERRFLFKIRFENPSVETKKKIWKSKLEWLEEKDVELFANKYDFSGGQIDNIVRKVTMDEVINGKRPAVDDLHALCKVEKLAKEERRIGF